MTDINEPSDKKAPNMTPIDQTFVRLVDDLSICDPGEGSRVRGKRYFGILSRWFYGVDLRKNRNYISNQYNGVNRTRILHSVFLQLLGIAEKSGYDLKSIEIDEAGNIVRLENKDPKRSIRKK